MKLKKEKINSKTTSNQPQQKMYNWTNGQQQSTYQQQQSTYQLRPTIPANETIQSQRSNIQRRSTTELTHENEILKIQFNHANNEIEILKNEIEILKNELNFAREEAKNKNEIIRQLMKE